MHKLKMNLQKFAGKTNVFPVSDNTFKVGKDKTTATTVADIETFSPAFSNGVETWTPMDTEGWQRVLMTAKASTITLSGKRNIGDAGNDYIADKLFKNGHDAEGYFEWGFPDGTTISWDKAAFDVKSCGGGDATNVGALEVDIISNGKPTVTPAL